MFQSSFTSTCSHVNNYHIRVATLATHCENFNVPASLFTQNPPLSNSIIPPVVQEGLSPYWVHLSPSLMPTFIFKWNLLKLCPQLLHSENQPNYLSFMFSTRNYFDTSCFSRFVMQTNIDLRKDSIELLFLLIHIDFMKEHSAKLMILNHIYESLLYVAILCDTWLAEAAV